MTTSHEISPVSNESIKSFIEEAQLNFNLKRLDNNTKYIIIQRSPERFWRVLLKQNFDVVKADLSIRFAGEAGADAGGLLREFLTLSMSRFTEIPGIILGQNDNIALKMIPEYLESNHYKKLGQLCGLAITRIGRGPECFNETLIKCLLNAPYNNDTIEIEDAELNHKLKQIEEGDTEELLTLDISLKHDKETAKRMFAKSFILLKNYSAIEQFSRGLASISASFTRSDNLELMKVFLANNEKKLALVDFLALLNVKNEYEKGSNQWNKIQDLTCDMELFYASVANGEIGTYKLSDLLFLFTGLDRIPPFGIHKNIDIEFVEAELPKISTCGYTIVLPMENVEKSLKIILEFGGGFGSV